MTPMPFMREINPETHRLLKRIYRQSRHHQVRQRSQCLLLRAQGRRVSELVSIFSVTRKTIYNWFDAWETRGVAGLYNRSGRGRKPTFDADQRAQIQLWARSRSPSSLKKVTS